MPSQPTVTELQQNGFGMVRGLISKVQAQALIDALGSAGSAGRRGMLAEACVKALASASEVLRSIQPHLPGPPRPARAIYFDKSPEQNWLVPWHQDLTIAVEQRVEIEGYGPWSIKDGLPHVQPAIELLEGMLTLRIHLDDTDGSNGALRVLPGSHRRGRLAPADISSLKNQVAEHVCNAAIGDALLMRPLLLHASSRSLTDRRRRILHIEYCGLPLPQGLQWNERA
jgi:hypothetical protein